MLMVAAAGFHEPGHHRVLMTPVGLKTQTGKAGVLLVERGYKVPCAVGGAVVHQQDAAVRRGKTSVHELAQLPAEDGRCLGQTVRLVIAGDNNI